jgi:glycosyltransferase involved in cell wall biosynthesis
MATYNGEKYIEEQLDSLARQAVLPYELVVCDDGSKDATIEIVRGFTVRAPFPVRININETNLGHSDNFLKAAALCRGEWIAFCDQDDVWHPNKLARIGEIIERYPGDQLALIGHTSFMATSNLELTGRRFPDFRRDEYIKRASNFGFFCIYGFSMVCRAQLINEIDSSLRPDICREIAFFDGHDQWISMVANAVGDIAYISEPLATWRRHDDALSWTPVAQNIISETMLSLSAVNPDEYFKLGNVAKETAESFQKISEKMPNGKSRERLMIASTRFFLLADNYFQRGELYKCPKRSLKVKALAKLARMNAYWGPKFHSLGWKSFVKDTMFALGFIG